MLDPPPSLLESNGCKESSSLSSHNGSRTSTPSISRFDGTPLFLLPYPHPDLNLPSPQDMAIKPAPKDTHGLQSDFAETRHNIHARTADEAKAAEQHPRCAAAPESVPSLSSLGHLLRTEKYQSNRGRHVRRRLYQIQVGTARVFRLLSITRSAQQTLAECIRCEDKQSFVNLYGVLRDAVARSTEPLTATSIQPWSEEEELARHPESFVDALPLPQRSSFLDLLSKITGDGSYLANRLSSLTHKELLALLPQKSTARSSESVFESSTRNASRVSQNLGYVVDGQTDQIASCEPANPLETLVWCTRNLHKDLCHDTRARSIWASVCASLVSDQIRGMEKVVPEVIDIWGASSPWPGRERLEAWIGRVLQDGAFILEQPSRQSFKVRIQGRHDSNAEDEGKTEAFFSSAVQSLLELFADANGASAIPDGAVRLCQNICTHILSPSQREAFSGFVLTRWLFNSFVVDTVTLPETHAMATERYISDNARQRILREVVLRTQKAVYHALHPWKHTAPASTELVTTINAIAARLQDAGEFVAPCSDSPPRDHRPEVIEEGSALHALSLNDVTVLIGILFPQRRPVSLTSESDRTGLHSSASSVSGFSLFPAPSSAGTTLAYPCFPTSDGCKATLLPDNLAEPGQAFPNDVSSISRIETSRLWEVRASIEEFVVSGRFQSDCQLAMIYIDHTTLTAFTQAMKLKDLCDTRVDELSSFQAPEVQFSSAQDLLEAVFKDAILESELNYDVFGSQADSSAAAVSLVLHSLRARIQRAKDQGQFILAHSYLSTLLKCEDLLSSNAGEELVKSVLAKLQHNAKSKLDLALATIHACERQLESLQPALNAKQNILRASIQQCDLLRGKMLYTTDVRTSAAYDDTRSIAAALKVMGKPKKPSRTRIAPPLRHWSGSRLSSTNLHLKTEAQILELLSASANHGGPNKLSDDQSKTLAAWLTSENVENLCTGEERLQKLCAEVRKAVDILTATSAPLWSSPLFIRDHHSPVAGQYTGASSNMGMPTLTSRFDALRLHTNVSANRDCLSSTTSSHPLSARSSRDYLESRSPTLTSRSSAPFWSPSASDAMSPSSATSVGSAHPQGPFIKKSSKAAVFSQSKEDLLGDTQRQITSLLLSEVTASMFNEGSETDQAFWTGLGGEIAEKYFGTIKCSKLESDSPAFKDRFGYQVAFESLISRFATSCDPAEKLNALVEIDTLIGIRESMVHEFSASQTETLYTTRAPDLEKHDERAFLSESKIDYFRTLFCDRQTRPATILRDLQYIAALVPSATREFSSCSEAFSHASLAIIGLKREVCNTMVETADSIIAYHSNNRGHGRSASTAQQQRDSAIFPATSQTPPAEDIGKYSMADAAHLLQITAKEGNAVAQRELATLYLTNPELMDHIIAPFARPKEVFKEELESKWRKNQDPARCDPVTMCVAHHWMSLSAKGGDALAKEYLKQREEMERLP